jgi:hypothetical protein
MTTIWKYKLEPETLFLMPIGAKILCLKVQDDTPFMWVLVDPTADKEKRIFRSYGTGEEMPDNPGTYIGTILNCKGTKVFHVFEEELG